MTLNLLTENFSISIYATESVITELFKEPCHRTGLWQHKFCQGLYRGMAQRIFLVDICSFHCWIFLLSASISRKSYLRSETTDYKARDQEMDWPVLDSSRMKKWTWFWKHTKFSQGLQIIQSNQDIQGFFDFYHFPALQWDAWLYQLQSNLSCCECSNCSRAALARGVPQPTTRTALWAAWLLFTWAVQLQ